ncbi:MAG: hypothetical protein WCV81_02435 [Microgenomates group bacterium]|jgi:hypothetical protein
MKKIISTLLVIFVFSLALSPILAKEKEDSDKVLGKERASIAQENRGNKPEIVSTKSGEEDKKIKVRTAVTSRWTAYDKLIIRAGQLLDKIQIRINRAKAAGADTKSSEALMTDARAKLTDAKSKMDALKSLVGTGLDKNSFKNAQMNLQTVHKDLNIVRQDVAKIISNLKSYNASTKSAELRSTTSADKKD